MSDKAMTEIRRIFSTRLDALAHVLDCAEKHFDDLGPVFDERLAPDMFPLGSQIVLACNQPRGFSQWCAGQPVENLPRELDSLDLARSHISDTKARVEAITAGDARLDETKRIGLGPGRYCELPGWQYVNDYLMPNFYFHITTTYAILRKLGVPVGKGDFMPYLAPHVRQEEVA